MVPMMVVFLRVFLVSLFMKAAQQTVEEIAFAHVVDAFGRGFLCAPNKVAVETFKSENLHDFSLLLRRQGTFPILDSGKETLGDLQLLGSQFTRLIFLSFLMRAISIRGIGLRVLTQN